MEHKKLKNQQGFLSIISIAIIVVVAIISSMLLVMFSGNIKSTENVSQSKSSFYLATSALQIANRDIIVDKKDCTYINDHYKDQTLSYIPGGRYTVKCCFNAINKNLYDNINETDSVIPLGDVNVTSAILNNITSSAIVLNSAVNFPEQGTVKIDNEYIAYNSKSGNTLLGITRGVAGTNETDVHPIGSTVYYGFLNSGVVVIGGEIIRYNNIDSGNLLKAIRSTKQPSAHTKGTSVSQSQYTLTATAGFPNLTEATGKRIVQETLLTGGDNTSGSFSFYSTLDDAIYKPGIVTTNNIDLIGSALIHNNNPISGTSDFPGSTILTSATTDFNGSSHTEYANGGTTNSCGTTPPNDVKCGTDAVAPGNLYNKIFAKSVSEMESMSHRTMIPSDFADQTEIDKIQFNEIVIVNGNLSLSKNIETKASPKIIIIKGNFVVKGNNTQVTLGTENNPTIVLVTGNFDMKGGNKKDAFFKTYGLLYVMGGFELQGGTDGFETFGLTAVESAMKLNGNTTMTIHTTNSTAISTLRKSNDLLAKFSFITHYWRKDKELFN